MTARQTQIASLLALPNKMPALQASTFTCTCTCTSIYNIYIYIYTHCKCLMVHCVDVYRRLTG